MQDLYHQPYCYDGHDRHIAVASILTMITVIIDTVINVTVSIGFVTVTTIVSIFH